MKYDYNLIRLTADKVRNETINVGIAVFKENYVETFILEDRAKLRAISNNIELEDLKKYAFSLSQASINFNKEDFLFLFSRGSLSLSGGGYFHIDHIEQYNNAVSNLMDRLVNPPPIHKLSKPKQSRIITRLKDIFKNDDLISNNLNDINHHKLVLGYPIDETKGLKADMLLKNSVYHLTETLEFSADNLVKNLERSALKALTITEAKNTFGNSLHSFIVYSLSATDEQKNASQIKLLENYTDNLINLEDKNAVSDYKDHIMNAISS